MALTLQVQNKFYSLSLLLPLSMWINSSDCQPGIPIEIIEKLVRTK